MNEIVKESKFRQFKPKSMNEIVKESEDKWRSNIRELASKGPIFDWVVGVHVEDRESAEFTLGDGTNQGTLIKSYHVYLDERECHISMTGTTHDTFYLHEGGGKIMLGRGNDSITRVYLYQGQRIEGSASYEIYGEDGEDRLIGSTGFRRDSDLGCYLNGGPENDILESRNIGDTLVGHNDSDHLIANWYSDAIMTGGSDSDSRNANRQDGSNLFEIEVRAGGARSGVKTITDFDRNDQIRFFNASDSSIDIMSGENDGEFVIHQSGTVLATVQTDENLLRLLDDEYSGHPGQDLILTGRNYSGDQFDYSFS